jgi:O-antigen/teichoic acid export membrane protein
VSERGERPEDPGERSERTDETGETGTDDTGAPGEEADGDGESESGEGTDDDEVDEGDDDEGTGERTPGLTIRITRAAATSANPARGGPRPWGVRYSASGWLCLAATVAASLVLPFVWAERPMATIGSTPGVLAGVLCVYAGGRLGHLIAQGRPRFLSFMFWTFVYIWFGLAPFLQIDANRFFLAQDLLGRGFSSRMQTRGMVLIWIGVVAFELGSVVAGRGKVRIPPAPVPGERRPLLSLRRVQLLSVAALVASTVALYQVGGPGTLFVSRRDLASALGYGQDMLQGSMASTVLRFPVFIAAFLAVTLVRHPRGRPWRDLSLGTRILFGTTIVAAVVINNPIASPRFLVGVVYGALAFAAIHPRNRVVIRGAMVGLLLTLLVIFPYLDLFRRSSDVRLNRVGVQENILEKADYSMYSQVMNGLLFVDRDGHTEGSQLTAAAFFFVPRSVWSGKAQDTGDTIHDALGYPDRLNQSSPLWVELYVDGGFALVALGFAGYGYLLTSLERRRLVEAVSLLTASSCLVPLVASYQLFILRGSLLGAIPRFVTLVLLARLMFVRRTVDQRPSRTRRSGIDRWRGARASPPRLLRPEPGPDDLDADVDPRALVDSEPAPPSLSLDEQTTASADISSGARHALPLRVGAMVASFATTAAVARAIGPADWGAYAVILATANLAYLLLGFQIQSQAARAPTDSDADLYLRPALLGGVLTGLAIVIVGLATTSGSGETAAVWLLALVAPARSVLSALIGSAIARRRPLMSALALTSVQYGRGLAALVTLTLASSVSLVSAAVIEVAAVLIGVAALGAGLLWAGYRPVLREGHPLRSTAGVGLQLALAAAGWFLMERTSTFVLDHYVPAAAVGRFRVGLRLAELPLELFIAGLVLFMPTIARSHLAGQRDAVRQAFYSSAAVFGPFCLILAVYGAEVVRVVFGRAFVSPGPVYLLLGAAVYIHIVNGPNGSYLVAVGRQALLAILTGLAAATDLVGQLVLVPHWGIEGSATTFLVAVTLLNLGCSGAMLQGLQVRPASIVRPAGFIALQLAATALVWAAVRQLDAGPRLTSLVGGFGIGVASLALGLAYPPSREAVRSLLPAGLHRSRVSRAPH